jgi:hypothetical protein
MVLQRSDYDQAARYVQGALAQLEQESFAKALAVRDVLNRIIRQLSPGDHFVGITGVAASVTMLRVIAEKLPPGEARTALFKAVAVLRDRSG